MNPSDAYPENRIPYFIRVLHQPPSALAKVMGSAEYPALSGSVFFYQTIFGVLVMAQLSGLPATNVACKSHFYGFHIHAGTSCTGTVDDAFADANGHYDPDECRHPNHAGDLPPLLGSNGNAFSICLTSRFTVPEIMGKTVIVHLNPDDFTTQPSGNAGQEIACGRIERYLPI